jgi:gamma-glutamylcyclotransferase (GGCT)/AIG2-like uncharacterized protein YtfP
MATKKKKETGHVVFVYGTLKRGRGNSHLLEHSVFLGVAVTVGSFAMFGGHGFPRMVRTEEARTAAARGYLKEFARPVAGELYRVNEDTLDQLDWLEGVPTHYTRQRIEVATTGDRVRDAWAYFIVDPDRYLHFSVSLQQPNSEGVLSW